MWISRQYLVIFSWNVNITICKDFIKNSVVLKDVILQGKIGDKN